MEEYKENFIDFLVRSGMLIFGDRTLRSGRVSPYFININPDDGQILRELGRAYAGAIIQHFDSGSFDTLYGPAYKGIAIAGSTAQVLWQEHGIKKYASYNRKEGKPGEGILLGHQITGSERVLILDDVFTTGDTKIEALNIIAKEAAGAKVVGLLIGADRQEIDTQGRNAIKAFSEEYKVPVRAVVTIEDIMEHLHNREIDGKVHVTDNVRASIVDYLKQYGVNYVKS